MRFRGIFRGVHSDSWIEVHGGSGATIIRLEVGAGVNLDATVDLSFPEAGALAQLLGRLVATPATPFVPERTLIAIAERAAYGIAHTDPRPFVTACSAEDGRCCACHRPHAGAWCCTHDAGREEELALALPPLARRARDGDKAP